MHAGLLPRPDGLTPAATTPSPTLPHHHNLLQHKATHLTIQCRDCRGTKRVPCKPGMGGAFLPSYCDLNMVGRGPGASASGTRAPRLAGLAVCYCSAARLADADVSVCARTTCFACSSCCCCCWLHQASLHAMPLGPRPSPPLPFPHVSQRPMQQPLQGTEKCTPNSFSVLPEGSTFVDQQTLKLQVWWWRCGTAVRYQQRSAPRRETWRYITLACLLMCKAMYSMWHPPPCHTPAWAAPDTPHRLPPSC